MRIVPLLCPAALLVGAGALAGCGGQAAIPAPKSSPELTTPEAALAAVTEAEQELSRVLGAPQGFAAPPPPAVAPRVESYGGAKPAAEPPPAAPPPPVVTAGRSIAKRESVDKDDHGTSPCATACSALASMERATEHLCGLAGDGDARCSGARERVKAASARVHAACPVCKR